GDGHRTRLVEDARCLKRTHGVVGAHGSRLYFVQLRTWHFLGRHYQLLGVAVIDTEDRCFIQRCLRSHRSGFGLETAFQHELHVIVTVRLNVLREPTQQTIQHATLFVLHRGYRRTASCLGLSGNRVSAHSIDATWSCSRSFRCGNGSFPHGNDLIPAGNDSIPHGSEPKPTVGGWKPIRSRSNRDGNDRKPYGGAAKPIRFVAKLMRFAPTPHRFASNPSR